MLKKTILLADDDRDFLGIEENILARGGFNVLCAQDSYHALHMALTEFPTVGVTDADGIKLQLAPTGNPRHDRLTVPANFPAAVT